MSTKEQKIRRCIQEYEADVVISVHPLMNDIPLSSCMKISHESNRHLPFFTVVTDLGSGHCTWFEKNVEKMFIASTAIQTLAIERGNVPKNKLVMSGLPIRYEFAFEAERLGDRNSLEGKIYQLQMRGYLDLFRNRNHDDDHVDDDHDGNINTSVDDDSDNSDRKVLLVMGGGEGVGSLSKIVHELYVHCLRSNIRTLILVVCGRNAKLKSSLETFQWESVYEQDLMAASMSIPSTKNFHQSDCLSKKDEKVQQEILLSLPSRNNKCQSKNDQLEFNQAKSIASQVTGMVLSPLKALSSPFTKKQDNKTYTKSKTHTFKIEQPPLPMNNIIEEEKKELSYCDYDNDNQPSTTRSISSSTESSSTSMSSIPSSQPTPSSPLVVVKPLGFVTNMAEYMVAADLLLTKAGPGTIAEAASLGLPVLLTSFLPGQEEGNIDFVIEKKFGEYVPDSNPKLIAKTVCSWLNNPDRMMDMSQHASKAGMPNAAEDIVQCIGKSVLRWKDVGEGEKLCKGELNN